MGRTSKLAYRFDMILVAIFLMGILVILLYIADKYEYTYHRGGCNLDWIILFP